MSIMVSDEGCYPWRNEILLQLQAKNKEIRKQYEPFEPLINSHFLLLESTETYRILNNRLSVEVEDLKKKICLVPSNPADRNNEIHNLRQKLFNLQEEVTELHKNRGQNAQKVIDLTNAMKQKEEEISIKNEKIHLLEEKIKHLNESINLKDQKINELKGSKNLINDEYIALQMEHVSIEKKYFDINLENKRLIEDLICEKDKLAMFLDQQIVNDKIKRDTEMKEELIKAAADMPIPEGDKFLNEALFPCFGIVIPKRIMQTFEAHEVEVTSLKWNLNGNLFASGGGDRKVKLWDLIGGRCILKAMLTGCNAGVTCVDFDTECNFVLGTSNDFACRIWSCNDYRLKTSLTGHSGKVYTAKFMSDVNKVFSGGGDKILKLWDLRNVACLRSFFVGSSCSDLVVLDSSNIVSGHFDNLLRFWDIRQEFKKENQSIAMTSKITSMDLSSDMTKVLVSTRDNILSLVDVRMNEILTTLNAPGFHISSDFSRVTLSPECLYAAAGSSDGCIFVWDIAKQKLEATLKDQSDPIYAVAWNPKGKSLISGAKHKSVAYWSEI